MATVAERREERWKRIAEVFISSNVRFRGDSKDRPVAVHKLNSAYMCLCLCTKQFLLPAGKAE
jgi:hypothetical protein